MRMRLTPSLSEASKDKTLVAYGFLWLRTFHHPIAIRLTIRPDRAGTLTGKVTSVAGGYEAGVMTQNESVEVSRAQVQQFLGLLQKAAFWASQTEGTAGGNDGARWIMGSTAASTTLSIGGAPRKAITQACASIFCVCPKLRSRRRTSTNLASVSQQNASGRRKLRGLSKVLLSRAQADAWKS